MKSPSPTRESRDKKGKSSVVIPITTTFTESEFSNGPHPGSLTWILTDKSTSQKIIQNHQEFFFKVTGASEPSLRSEPWWPPSECQVACSTDLSCLQCPGGSSGPFQCGNFPDLDAPGHYCGQQLWYDPDPAWYCYYGNCLYCHSAAYPDAMSIDGYSIEEVNGGFSIHFDVSYKAGCMWAAGDGFACNLSGMCLIRDYTAGLTCFNAASGGVLCSPIFEQGSWYPTLGAGCSAAGQTFNYSPFLNRCTNDITCGLLANTTAGSGVGVTLPEPAEADCSAPPDWECCTDDSGSQCVGGPVNVASGNVSYEETDISLNNSPFEIPFTRSYNSQEENLTRTHGVFGYGWTHPFNQHLEQSNTLTDGRRVFRLVNLREDKGHSASERLGG